MGKGKVKLLVYLDFHGNHQKQGQVFDIQCMRIGEFE